MTATPTTPTRRTATSATAQRASPKRRPKAPASGRRCDRPPARGDDIAVRETASASICRCGRRIRVGADATGEPGLERLHAPVAQSSPRSFRSRSRRRWSRTRTPDAVIPISRPISAESKPPMKRKPTIARSFGSSRAEGVREVDQRGVIDVARPPSDRRRRAPGPFAGAGFGRSGAPRWRRPTSAMGAGGPGRAGPSADGTRRPRPTARPPRRCRDRRRRSRRCGPCRRGAWRRSGRTRPHRRRWRARRSSAVSRPRRSRFRSCSTDASRTGLVTANTETGPEGPAIRWGR